MSEYSFDDIYERVYQFNLSFMRYVFYATYDQCKISADMSEDERLDMLALEELRRCML